MIILKKLAKSLDVNHTALYNSSVRKNCDVWQGIEREPQPRICGTDLPDCGPLVSFETTVGRALKPGEIIDVDIEAIYEAAAAVGLSEREMNGVDLVVASGGSSKLLPGGCSGYYQNLDGRHCIRIRCCEDAAKIACHEFQHMANEKDGLYIGDRRAAILELADVTGERIGNYSSRVVLLATGTEILAFANGFDKCSLYCGIVAVASICATGLAKVCHIINYRLHPAEVRARQAEKLDTPDILKFSSN